MQSRFSSIARWTPKAMDSTGSSVERPAVGRSAPAPLETKIPQAGPATAVEAMARPAAAASANVWVIMLSAFCPEDHSSIPGWGIYLK